MFLINNNNDIKLKIKEEIITYFIADRNKNIKLIKYFVEKLERKDNEILTIFYENIKDSVIAKEDFYLKQVTIKYELPK